MRTALDRARLRKNGAMVARGAFSGKRPHHQNCRWMGLEGTQRGRSVRLPAGGSQLGAAGRARSAHVMQFRPVGVECLGEEIAEEGADSGEGIGVSVAAFCRGGKGCRIDARHDESCFFPRLLTAERFLEALAGVSDATY